jgi:hypothetical protein
MDDERKSPHRSPARTRLGTRASALRWAVASSRLLPARALRAPYAAALAAIRAAVPPLVAPGGALVWARNSWLTPQFKPLVSDLDLTIWLEGEPSLLQLRQLRGVLSSIRAALPFVGEINLHERTEAGWLSEYANRFELGRDPELLARVGLQSPLSVQAQATVFLLRMAENDLESLTHRPELRRGKWEIHLRSVGAGVTALVRGGSLLDQVLMAALQPLGTASDELIPSARRFFEALTAGQALHELTIEPAWWLLFPHRFAFAEPPVGLPEPGPKGIEVFRAQLAWEVWGLISQYRLNAERQPIAEHARNLLRADGRISPDGDSKRFSSRGLEHLVATCSAS